MEFKIDTRDTYTRISPSAEHLDAIVAEGLAAQCTALAEGETGGVLIDLRSCQTAGADALDSLAALHEQLYGEDCSLVFTNLNEAVARSFKDSGLQEVLHIAPTDIEGIDIISMEILERDLLKED